MATVKKPATKKSTKTAKPAAAKKPAAIKPTTKKTAKKGGCKGLFIGIIIAAVVAIAAAIVCFICFGRANLVGTYKLTGIERDGEDQSNSISILEGLGMTATMELRDDNTGELDLFGEKSEITYDGKTLTIDGQSTEYKYKDGELSMEQGDSKLIFTKDAE